MKIVDIVACKLGVILRGSIFLPRDQTISDVSIEIFLIYDDFILRIMFGFSVGYV